MDRCEAFDAMSTTALNVRLAWASCELVTDDVDSIQVLIAGSAEDVEELAVQCEEGRLTVTQPAFGLTTALKAPHWLEILVRIPRTWRGAADLATITGPLTLRGLTGTDLTLSTVSGEVRAMALSGITVSLHSLTGPVHAELIRTEKLTLRCLFGTASVTESSARHLRTSALTGTVSLSLTDEFETLSGVSGTGKLAVSAPMDECLVRMSSLRGKLHTYGVSLPGSGIPICFHSITGDLELTSTI